MAPFQRHFDSLCQNVCFSFRLYYLLYFYWIKSKVIKYLSYTFTTQTQSYHVLLTVVQSSTFKRTLLSKMPRHFVSPAVLN